MNLKEEHTLKLVVQNKPGVLVRIAHVFARRGCNIKSLHVSPHKDDEWSTMIIDVGDVYKLEQVVLQLQKLVDVASVTKDDDDPKTGE